MSPKTLLARLEALERKAGTGSGEPYKPLRLVETRDGGQTFTDNEGRVYDREGLDQLGERYRLVIVKIPSETEYREVLRDGVERNGTEVAGQVE